MPVVLITMTLNAIFCVTLLIGRPMPIILSSAYSVAMTATTTKSSSSWTFAWWSIVLTTFGCFFLHLYSFILIIFNRSIESHLMALKIFHQIIKGKNWLILRLFYRSNYMIKLWSHVSRYLFQNCLISNFLVTWSNFTDNFLCSG